VGYDPTPFPGLLEDGTGDTKVTIDTINNDIYVESKVSMIETRKIVIKAVVETNGQVYVSREIGVYVKIFELIYSHYH
jgi:hypothetical protein